MKVLTIVKRAPHNLVALLLSLSLAESVVAQASKVEVVELQTETEPRSRPQSQTQYITDSSKRYTRVPKGAIVYLPEHMQRFVSEQMPQRGVGYKYVKWQEFTKINRNLLTTFELPDSFLSRDVEEPYTEDELIRFTSHSRIVVTTRGGKPTRAGNNPRLMNTNK
ncbi:hypothetical protein [Persicirhabdus sediminis]|uniref:Uncharacterized protein n=1 Tax=Persicirhabdus sediminis TaxID=454144 RepID=A0A8J7MH38_9BACT|nr:hypothetical protein [Persicirhabdus sediminis]MBK1791734.1 hypothetical protein [Persicirhabdus sediminis]